MVYTPVGIKCKQCASLLSSAKTGVKPRYFWRAIGAGLATAVAGGFLLGEIVRLIRFSSILLSIALGYGIGEAVSWGARRNRGLSLQILAGFCALLAFAISGLYISRVWHGRFWLFGSLFDLIGIGVAVYRLRDRW